MSGLIILVTILILLSILLLFVIMRKIVIMIYDEVTRDPDLYIGSVVVGAFFLIYIIYT